MAVKKLNTVLSLIVCLSVHLSVCLTIHSYIHLSIYPSVYLLINLSVSSVTPTLSSLIFPSNCLFIRLSICPSVCLFCFSISDKQIQILNQNLIWKLKKMKSFSKNSSNVVPGTFVYLSFSPTFVVENGGTMGEGIEAKLDLVEWRV